MTKVNKVVEIYENQLHYESQIFPFIRSVFCLFLVATMRSRKRIERNQRTENSRTRGRIIVTFRFLK